VVFVQRQWAQCWSGRQDSDLRPLDPQDVGVGVCPGHWWCRCRVHDRLTCGSSARVQGVWSPSGPQALFFDRGSGSVVPRIVVGDRPGEEAF
jgi:hypothetical protein